MSCLPRDYMTIGEVVEALADRFPDLSISKVRFLEEEGLVSPERTAGGYRKFRADDVTRIEHILRLQKEHFLPLAVIRERLADYDKGKIPSELRAIDASAPSVALGQDPGQSVRVEDVPTSLGLPATFIKELEEFNLIRLVDGERGKEITAGDVQIAHVCWEMRRFGVDPRHLRMYDTFAERESTFFSQILMPTFRHRTPETRQKLAETLGELSEHTRELTALLLRRSLARVFEDVV